MRPSISLLAGAAIAGVLIISPAVRAPLALAQSGECASFPGYEQIEAESTGMYVDGQGPANPVKMEPVGSCYKLKEAGTINRGGYTDTKYTYDDQDNRCLYWDASTDLVTTAANANGCADQPNEEFFGERPVTSNGWPWWNVAALDDGYNTISGAPCTNGGMLTAAFYVGSDSCDYWNFPSDGG